jgi:hypothetical protein
VAAERAVQRGYADDRSHRGSLACTVWTEESEYQAGRHGEAKSVKGHDLAVRAPQVGYLKYPILAIHGLALHASLN